MSGPELIELEVTEAGCAAVRATDGVCTVNALVVEPPSSKAGPVVAKATWVDSCPRGDITLEVLNIKVSRRLPNAVEITSRTNAEPMTLTRTTDAVAMNDAGLPRLWANSTTKPTGHRSVRSPTLDELLAARAKPDVESPAVDAKGRDYCDELVAARKQAQ